MTTSTLSHSNGTNPSQSTTFFWFRHDLRLRDQLSLTAAIRHAKKQGNRFLMLYFFEPRWRQSDQFGNERIGEYRAQFILDTLQELKLEVEELGGELLVLDTDPLSELPRLAEKFGGDFVFASRHVADEETRQEQALAKGLDAQNCKLALVWNHTLYQEQDLPFALGDLPDIYTQFRKQVERSARVGKLLNKPSQIPKPPQEIYNSSWGCQLVELQDEWRDKLNSYGKRDPKATLLHQGGAKAGEARLAFYFWESNLIESYKDTRNGLIGPRYSTQFSPWLAIGALSPRWIWHETLRYEDTIKSNSSTYWVRFELLWREYFQWVAYAYGSALFKPHGLTAELQRKAPKLGRASVKHFQRWTRGETGNDFVDANMKELNLTGFMSNRGRQNVASYLVHDLGVDWRMGAGYFESKLIDYDPASNWGNWAYIAGVGNDPRPQRKFNTRGQAERYDPKGEYRALWLS